MRPLTPTQNPDAQKGRNVRNVTPYPEEGITWKHDDTPPADTMEGRYRIYRLCLCGSCDATGKDADAPKGRCVDCRGEGKTLDCVATATDPESVGVALIQLALEDEFQDCPIGIMDRPEGETGKWLIKPWLPSARNISDAGRTLAHAKKEKTR